MTSSFDTGYTRGGSGGGGMRGGGTFTANQWHVNDIYREALNKLSSYHIPALKDGQVFQCNFGTFLRQNKLTTNKNKMYFFLP